MIKHFNQGDLDGLCGIYAIVNAILHRIIQNRSFADTAADELFEIALRAIPQRFFPDVLIEGLNFLELLKIARKVVKTFSKIYPIEIEVTAPYQGDNMTSLTSFLNSISTLHSNKPTAFIFGVSNYTRSGTLMGGHWVAFKEFKAHGFKVLNNGRDNYIRSTSLRINGTGKNRLDYRETIMFETKSISGMAPNFGAGQ